MKITPRNIRINKALQDALKAGALPIEDYNEACRLITLGEQADAKTTATQDAAEEIVRSERYWG